MKSSPKSLVGIIGSLKNITRKCDAAKRMFSNDSKVYLFDHDTSVKKIGISNTDSDSTKYRAKISDNFSIGNTIILILPLKSHHDYLYPYPYHSS